MKMVTQHLAAVLIFLVVLSGCNAWADGRCQQEVKIGVLTSLSGPFGQEGGQHGCIGCSEAITNGAQLAVWELNRRGGVLGRPIRLMVRDTHGTNAGASKAVARLADARVFAIIGVHQSEAVLGAAEAAAEKRLPLIVTTAAHPLLTARIEQDPGKYRWVFRIGKALAQWGDVTRVFLEKIARAKNYYFVGYDAIWNHKLAEYLVQHCQVPCLGACFYPPGLAPFQKDLEEIKRLRPDIVVDGDPGGIRYVLLHQQHHIPGTIFSVGGALANVNTIRALDGAGNLLVFHCAYYNTASAFYKNFMDYHGFAPLWYCDVLAYEAVHLLAAAVTKAGSFNQEQLLSTLAKGKFRGLCGTYQFDQNHQARWGQGFLTGYICQWHGQQAKVLYPIKEAGFVRR